MLLKFFIPAIIILFPFHYPHSIEKSTMFFNSAVFTSQNKSTRGELIFRINKINPAIRFKKERPINQQEYYLSNYRGKLSIGLRGRNNKLTKVECSIVTDFEGRANQPVLKEIIKYTSGEPALRWVETNLTKSTHASSSFTVRYNPKNDSHILFQFNPAHKTIIVTIDNLNH